MFVMKTDTRHFSFSAAHLAFSESSAVCELIFFYVVMFAVVNTEEEMIDKDDFSINVRL